MEGAAPKRFVGWWIAGTIGLLALAALTNLVIDPYAAYGWISIPGVNQKKTQAVDESRLAKPYMVEREQPTTLLLGSSRVEVGFDPNSTAWPSTMRPVFNLGIPGSGPYEQYRLLQHAFATAHPKYVLIGTGFGDWHVQPSRTVINADTRDTRQIFHDFDARLLVTADGKPNPNLLAARVHDIATTLLSLDALLDSARTVLSQRDPYATSITPLGLNTAAGFRAAVQSDGTYNLFADKDRGKISEIIQWSTEPRLEPDSLTPMINFARQHGAAVIVVIGPVHADELEIYRLAGVMRLYDDWRKQIANIVAAADSRDVTLWDFSAISPYTSERLPPREDRHTELRWFWESNHFTRALGDVVIRRLFDDGPSDFGTQATMDALPRQLEHEDRLRRDYEARRPQDVMRVAALYDAASRAACQANAFFCNRDHPISPRDDRDIAAADATAKP